MMDDTPIALDQAIREYLEWMAVNGYVKSTQQGQKCTLRHFRSFIDVNRYHWDDIFTRRTLNRFKKTRGKHHAHAVSGLSRYLFAQGKIARPIRVAKVLPMLSVIYEDYLLYRKKYRHASDRQANHIRRVLSAFDRYCQQNDIQLRSLKIDHVDAFRDECFI